MRAITALQLRIAYSLIALGAVLGIASFVRTGSLCVAVGTAVVAIAQQGKRKFERYLPLAIAASLFFLALALPKGL
jgi:hypothetical protein